jgi:hypothetical protein
VAPTKSFDIAFSGIYNDAEIRSTLTSTDALGNVSVVSGIEEGGACRRVPELQGSVAATYRWMVGKSSQVYATGVYQYVGLALHAGGGRGPRHPRHDDPAPTPSAGR